MSATLVAGLFLIVHYFLLLRFPLQKTPTDFLVLGCPKWLTFGLSFFKTSRFHLFRLNFWLPFLLSFFPSELIPSCQIESLPSCFPSWFFILGSSRYQPLAHELLFSKLSGSFLHHWMADRNVSILVPCVSWHSF